MTASTSQPRHPEVALGVMKRSFATISLVDEVISAWQQSNTPVEPSWQTEERRRRADADEAAEGFVLIDAAALDPEAQVISYVSVCNVSVNCSITSKIILSKSLK